MSTLLNFTATAVIQQAGGFRMGGVTLSAGTANATVVISDGGVAKMQLTALANTTIPHNMTDPTGAVFFGSATISTFTGSGAALNVEEL